MEELLELAFKKIGAIEKRLEKYYQYLKFDNELDFILKGTYLLSADIENVLTGEYWGSYGKLWIIKRRIKKSKKGNWR